MKKKYVEKVYKWEDVASAIDEEGKRIRTILEYILNKNSHPMDWGGFDHQNFLDDIQDLEDSLLNQ